ncbi:MAG: heme exporter protein CcmB [Chloroflexi bacterium]|nr:heme exporter protein CcmB [Chloroflexota bacterium]
MSRYFQDVGAIIWKDVISELRTKEMLSSMVVFAVLVILIFNFALEVSGVAPDLIVPGVLWVAITFAGILGLNRSMASEKDKGCLEGLMLCPVDRSAIFLGKMLGNVIFMLIVEVVVVPVLSVLFNLPILMPWLILIVVLGTFGFATVGTLLSTVAVNTRTREVMLPVLLFPIIVPLIIASVKATRAIIIGQAWADILPWLQLLGAFDVIFLVVCLLVFQFVIQE